MKKMICGEEEKKNLYREDLKALIEYKRGENGDRLKDIVKGVCQINILYKLGDVEGAEREWKKAKDLNSESKTLEMKLKKKKYIEEIF